MKNKIVSVIFAFIMLVSFAADAAAFTDVAKDAPYAAAADNLAALGILDGYADGTFRPNDHLTREQFAKLIVCAMGKRDDAVSSSGAAAFTDVPQNHWAIGFISYVNANSIILGYPNGTFGLGEDITYAQAVTVILRAMGYTDDAVGYHWPADYIKKAASLEITDGISFDQSAAVTRGDAAMLLERALFTEMNNSKDLMVNLLDVTVFEDAIICATPETDGAISPGYAVTTSGTFKFKEDATPNVGRRGTLVLDNYGDVIIFRADDQVMREYTVSSMFVDSGSSYVTVEYDGGAQKSMQLAAGATAYVDGTKTTVKDAAASAGEGSTLRILYNEDGVMEYVSISGASMEGPYTVASGFRELSQVFDGLDAFSVKVIRKGVRADISDISRFDVVYYCRPINTLYAYTDRVTGIYKEAFPIKANVTSIDLSGTKYTLSSSRVINKLGESDGAFALGDRVTLLFGRSGEVVDAVSLDDADLSNFGVVIGASSSVSEDADTRGRLEYYVRLILADGGEVEYRADDDYDDYRGDFCSIAFEGGVASLSRVAKNVITGAIDKTAKTYGGRALATNYTVLELVDLPDSGDAVIKKIDLDDIAYTSLTSSHVIHVQTGGEMNDIALLYLNDVSGARYTYGLATDVPKNSSDYGYSVLIDGAERTFGGYFAKKIARYTGVGMLISNGSLEEIFPLEKEAAGKKINAYTSGRIRVDNEVYAMDDGVSVYYGSLVDGYRGVALADHESLDYSSIELYADKAAKYGGKVRVIVLQK